MATSAPPRVQPSSVVGPVDSPDERQAERVAEELEGPEPGRSTASAAPPFVSPDMARAIGGELGAGRALDAGVRADLYERAGVDTSPVRVHTGRRAAELADGLGARAFTLGRDVFFADGHYRPDTSSGRRLIAHEVAHVGQQRGRPRIQRDPKKTTSEQPPPRVLSPAEVEKIRARVKAGGKLTPWEVESLNKTLGKMIVDKVLGSSPFSVGFNSGNKPRDLHHHFRAKLEVELSGLARATAGSLEGTMSTVVEVIGTTDTGKLKVVIHPPADAHRLAALARNQVFPNNHPIELEFGEKVLKYYSWITGMSGTLGVTFAHPEHKPKGKRAVRLSSDKIPKGVALHLDMTKIAKPKTTPKMPSDHWLLTPKPRVFAAGGGGGAGGKGFGVGTLGADVPLAHDTGSPWIYGGLGARASYDSRGVGQLGGTLNVGLNFDPLSLQVGFGAGAAFLPEGAIDPGAPAATVPYFSVEGMIGYRVVNSFELLGILTVGGGVGKADKQLPLGATGQIGAAYHW